MDSRTAERKQRSPGTAPDSHTPPDRAAPGTAKGASRPDAPDASGGRPLFNSHRRVEAYNGPPDGLTVKLVIVFLGIGLIAWAIASATL